MAGFAGLGNLSDEDLWRLASSQIKRVLSGPQGGIPTQQERDLAIRLYNNLSDIMTPEWQPGFLGGYFTPPAGMALTPNTLLQLRQLAQSEYSRTGDWDRAMGFLPRATTTPPGGTRTAAQRLADLGWNAWVQATKEGRAYNPFAGQFELTAPARENLFNIGQALLNLEGYLKNLFSGSPAPSAGTPGATPPPATPKPGAPTVGTQDPWTLLEDYLRKISTLSGKDAVKRKLIDMANRL